MESLKNKSILGKEINEKEVKISESSAIHLAIKLLGIKKGNIVFCSSLASESICSSIIYEEAEPVFIDSEYKSLNMSSIALKKAFKYYYEKGILPKAVIVAHIYGQSTDMDKIMEICNKYKVQVIEDVTEAIGVTYKGIQTGTIGKYGTYSFDGDNIITTAGSKLLVFNDDEYLKKSRFWKIGGGDNFKNYKDIDFEYNNKITNIIEKIESKEISSLDKRIIKKKYIYDKYKEGFKNIKDIEMANICDYGDANYCMSIAILSSKSKVESSYVISKLKGEGIEVSQIRKPMHLQQYFKNYNFFSSYSYHGISIAGDIFSKAICLPSDIRMNDNELKRVIKSIDNILK